MQSASAKKNEKKHAAKRRRAAAKKACVETATQEQLIWAMGVISKNICWFHLTMDRPMQSPYKSNLLKQHLESGSLKGTLNDWLKMSRMFTSYYVAGELNGKYISTSYISAEFFDGADRYVLTNSSRLYKLGQSAVVANKVNGNQVCPLSVEEEKKHARLYFMQWMRLSSNIDRKKHIKELEKLMHYAIDGKKA